MSFINHEFAKGKFSDNDLCEVNKVGDFQKYSVANLKKKDEAIKVKIQLTFT